MRLFAIADLHLSFSSDKPMDVFPGWENYISRLQNNWQKTVEPEDTVVIAGDVSWSMKLGEAFEDFKFLNSLNGKKIIIKGNHDFWWSTATKIKTNFKLNGFDTLDILFNNCVLLGDTAICGTRGWVYDGTGEKDIKVINRECGRLERSLACAKEHGAKPVVFLHYPPVYGDYVCDEILEVLNRFDIKTVYYGHIHGSGIGKTVKEYDGITLKNISADCVSFTPVFIPL